jgi:hypothetical protein
VQQILDKGHLQLQKPNTILKIRLSLFSRILTDISGGALPAEQMLKLAIEMLSRTSV